jgi:hypothetical protein
MQSLLLEFPAAEKEASVICETCVVQLMLLLQGYFVFRKKKISFEDVTCAHITLHCYPEEVCVPQDLETYAGGRVISW